MLEFQVESNAEHAVGAGVAVLLIACLSGSSHIASAVEGLHITQVDACAARYVQANTTTHAVARCGEAEVVHIGIAEIVVSGLPTCRYGNKVADVVFGAGSDFPCAAVDAFLLVAIGCGVAVVVEVVTGIDA